IDGEIIAGVAELVESDDGIGVEDEEEGNEEWKAEGRIEVEVEMGVIFDDDCGELEKWELLFGDQDRDGREEVGFGVCV
uniref:hypothetical protein n=1 Tax=Cytobacillus oceanisediminis TaxID=665099 RepID=UPI00164274CE